MPSVVLASPSQLAALESLLVAHPRQRGFERQAKLHPQLLSLPHKTITTFYSNKQRSAGNTRGRPPKLSLAPDSSSPTTSLKTETPQSHDGLTTPKTPSNNSGDVFRPLPVRSLPTTYSPTTLMPPSRGFDTVVQELESIVKREEAEIRKVRETSDDLLLRPLSVKMGDWERYNLPGQELTAVLDATLGAFEITTRFEKTEFRFHIPLTTLSHLSLSPDSVLTLALLVQPDFLRRPSIPIRKKWELCPDFTSTYASSHHSCLSLRLDSTAPSTSALATHPLLQPLLLVLPPTPPTSSVSYSPNTYAAQAPIAHSCGKPTFFPSQLGGGTTTASTRLFFAAHSQAIAQRSTSLSVNPAPAPLLPQQITANTNAEHRPALKQALIPIPKRKLTPEEEEMEMDAWYASVAARTPTELLQHPQEMDVDELDEFAGWW